MTVFRSQHPCLGWVEISEVPATFITKRRHQEGQEHI